MACCKRLEIHLEKIKVISLTEGFLFLEAGKDDILVTTEGHGEHVVPPGKTHVPTTTVELDADEYWPSGGSGPVLLTIRPTETCRINVRTVVMVWEADPESIASAVKATTEAALKWAGALAAGVVPNAGLVDTAIDAVKTIVHEILELFGLSNDLMMDFYFDLNQSMDSTIPLSDWDWGRGWDAGYPEVRGPNQIALRKTAKRHGGEWEVTLVAKRYCADAVTGTTPGE